MQLPSGSIRPLPTFQTPRGEDATPADLLQFLQSLSTDGFADSVNGPAGRAANTEAWAGVISELATNFLENFPLPEFGPWSALHERIGLSEATLDVLEKALTSLNTLTQNRPDWSERLLLQLFKFICTLRSWPESPVESDTEVLSPSKLRQKALKTTTRLISLDPTFVPPPNWNKDLYRLAVDRTACLVNDVTRVPIVVLPLSFKLTPTGFVIANELSEALDGLNDPNPVFRLISYSQLFGFLTDLLCSVIQASKQSPFTKWFQRDLDWKVHFATVSVVKSLLSNSFPLSVATRVQFLSPLLENLPAICNSEEVSLSVGPIIGAVIHFRLKDDIDPEWRVLDSSLMRVAKGPMQILQPHHAVAFIDVIEDREWKELDIQLQECIVSFVRSSIKFAKDSDFQILKACLLRKRQAGHISLLTEEIKLREKKFDDQAVLGKRKRDQSRRERVEILLEEVSIGFKKAREDETIEFEKWIENVISRINGLTELIPKQSTTFRGQVGSVLRKLPCILSHQDDECPDTTYMDSTGIIPLFLNLIRHLLPESGETRESSLLNDCYRGLGSALKHTAILNDSLLENTTLFLFSRLQSKDRRERLAAGRILAVLVSRDEVGHEHSAQIFKQVQALLCHARDTVRETALVALGLMGKCSRPDIIRQVLRCFTAQLDRSTIILRGLISVQLHSLSKYYNKSPYALVSPYLSEIAMDIIPDMHLRPNLWLEFCRFIALTPSDFLSITFPHVLPHLFATRNHAALTKLEKELDRKLHSLLISEAPQILAHVLMMADSTEIHKSLEFILGTLTEAANAEIRIGNFVKSSLVALLSNLVIAMGDEDTSRAELGRRAVGMVQGYLASEIPQSEQVEPGDTGKFLRAYVLGIISHLSDVLQDVKGKKTLEAKSQILRGFAALILCVGPTITSVAPQIIAMLQTCLSNSLLAEGSLRVWHTFLVTISIPDLSQHIGVTSAAFINAWPELSEACRHIIKESLGYIIGLAAQRDSNCLKEIVDLSSIPELSQYALKVNNYRRDLSFEDHLHSILTRTDSSNPLVITQALQELKTFMVGERIDFLERLASGDAFDATIGQIVSSLFNVANRDGDGYEQLRLLAFECIGILGAVDPDRFDVPVHDTTPVVLNNYNDEAESIMFSTHLIVDLLVRAFKSTSDMKYQGHLAFAIQELLKVCKFTRELVVPSPSVISLKVRGRWNKLPKHVLETVTPFLESRFTLNTKEPPLVEYPIYNSQSTYREWIQVWATHLIPRVSGATAQRIFNVFRPAVRNRDATIAYHLLPHLVLNIMVSGDDQDIHNIRQEISTVLEDQTNPDSLTSTDKRFLSAQAIFMLMDHLNKWVRIVRQETSLKRSESKRSRHNSVLGETENQLVRVDSILCSIDQNLIAEAAFRCKSYARSLMNFEKQIVDLRNRDSPSDDLQSLYDRLHEIYAHLEEPDGMEGISTRMIDPSLEHQIRQHESTGRWTSAQSCWEVRLQQSPDNLEYHIGLLRCLRNLGHYDTLRTHIRGVLTRNQNWRDALAGFEIESAWIGGDWETVKDITQNCTSDAPEVAFAGVLLSLRSSNEMEVQKTLSHARMQLGSPIAATNATGYRRVYDPILNLHLLRDLELICRPATSSPSSQMKLSRLLATRLNASSPTYRSRELILSMHRIAFTLRSSTSPSEAMRSLQQAWLSSSKIARKAGHWQTAYSSVLQAQQAGSSLSFLQSCKLVKAIGEPLRALQELDHALQRLNIEGESSQLSDDSTDPDIKGQLSIKWKARLLRARWMRDSDRFDTNIVLKEFHDMAKNMAQVESAHFHHGHFQDECYKALSTTEKRTRGSRMNLATVRAYTMAIRFGSKYAYQTIPRLLTLWLDMGEDAHLSTSDVYIAINSEIEVAIKLTPSYKWMTAFPQIVSRVDHSNDAVYTVLSRLIFNVLHNYPQQGLWLFTSVVKSTKPKREKRGKAIIDMLKTNPSLAKTLVPRLVTHCVVMSTELLALCDYPIKDDSVRTLSMSRDFPRLAKLVPSSLIIPLQESLTVTLPSRTGSETDHQPFPLDAPTFSTFYDEIDVMKSLAKPRKITLQGSNGQIYMFLGKPKDDLRKDARLMDFNSIINKLLKTNSDSRRRRLYIRTYSVVTLNEECGFIQWVPNTMPMRPILLKYYGAKGIESWSKEMNGIFSKIKESSDRDAAKTFESQVLKQYPPLFHEWFIETFPEPSAWLASRLAYARTAAVMSMVGFILGLGDRHLENILLDITTGDVVHVDFNCLFERGKTLDTPERVPFRLTNNMVDGLGVTGVEGMFRIACEVSMQILRDNKDVLMNVLDAFIHDPLVEWVQQKKNLERNRNTVKESTDLRKLAKNALTPIERKLKGLYIKYINQNEKRDREISTSNLVQMLIEESTDLRNLAKMYPGWAPWH